MIPVLKGVTFIFTRMCLLLVMLSKLSIEAMTGIMQVIVTPLVEMINRLEERKDTDDEYQGKG